MTTDTTPTPEAATATRLLDLVEQERGLVGRHALLACSTPILLDDRLAEGLIRVATGADSVRAGVLMVVVKKLECVTVESSIRDWFIHSGTRRELALRAARERKPETLTRLHRHTADYADAEAAQIKLVSRADYDALRGLRYEAAYQRLFLGDAGTKRAAVRAVLDLYERADQRWRRRLASSLEINAPELELLPGGAPAEFEPLRAAARERARTPEPSELTLKAVTPPALFYVKAGQDASYPDLLLHVADREGTRPDPHGGPYPLDYLVARCDAVVSAGRADRPMKPYKLGEYVPCEPCRAAEEFAAHASGGGRT